MSIGLHRANDGGVATRLRKPRSPPSGEVSSTAPTCRVPRTKAGTERRARGAPSDFVRRAALTAGASCTLVPAPALAALTTEMQFVLSSFSFLFWGALVMWMCAGFMMLEAGSVRTRNASVICLKNIGLYSIAGLAFYLIGYNIMYIGVEEGGWFGTLDLLYGTSEEEKALLA